MIAFYSRANGAVAMALACTLVWANAAADDFSQWAYSAPVVLNTGPQGAVIDNDVFNFPVLVGLDSSNFDFGQAQPDGADIRFANGAGAHLAHEIEQWDAGGRNAAVWVLVDTVRANDSAQSISMYWGNAAAADSSCPACVFDTANGFVGVYHLNDNPANDSTGAIRDATGYGNNGTSAGVMSVSNLVSGKIGGALDFEYDNHNYISLANESNFDITDEITISAWVSIESWEGSYMALVAKEDNAFRLHRNSSQNRLKFACTGASSQSDDTENMTPGRMYYIAARYTGSDIALWADSVKLSRASSGSISTNNDAVMIGRNEVETSRDWDGVIDEVRISRVARSDAWIELSYQNQRSGSQFVQIGPPSTLPLPAARLDTFVSSISEESGGATDVCAVTVSRAAAGDETLVYVKVLYGGTADAGVDYEPLPSWYAVTIAADSISGSAVIGVTPFDDSDDEGAETIVLSIGADSMYTIGSPDSTIIALSDSDAVIPPTIIAHPVDQSVLAGDLATFAVTADGSGPYSYLWRKNGVGASAPDDSAYVTPPVSLADDSAWYDCIVSNSAGSDTSDAALLSVSPRPAAPYITSHPVPTAVAEQDSAILCIRAVGDEPLAYQWFTDSGAIAGAIDTVLRIGPVTPALDGSAFWCAVENIAGRAVSRTATLTVTRPSSRMIVVSGELYDYQRIAVGAGESRTMDFVVRLYPSRTADSALYVETFFDEDGQGVEVVNGSFVVRLGEGTAAGDLLTVIREHADLYVSFAIAVPGATPETLEPRTPLTASPYALSAFPAMLKGAVAPDSAGLDAPVGTHYVNTSTSQTFVKTFNGWAELHE